MSLRALRLIIVALLAAQPRPWTLMLQTVPLLRGLKD
jgi:hypothetical protein